MSDLQLNAQPRSLVGRKVRQLRTQGLVPVVVYGKTQPSENLQVDERSFGRVLQTAGLSQLVQLNVEGGKTHDVLIREVHRHPVTHRPLHVDFYAVDLTVKQEIQVPVHSVGRPSELVVGLMVLQTHDHVLIEALPRDIPAHIEVDISNLNLEQPITVADLPVIPGVTYLTDADEIIFNMITTRAGEAEEEEEAAEMEGAEPELVGADEDEEEE
ncbi:MAG: 50S ribosomal protein L25 [Caldilineaceae bacterium]